MLLTKKDIFNGVKVSAYKLLEISSKNKTLTACGFLLSYATFEIINENRKDATEISRNTDSSRTHSSSSSKKANFIYSLFKKITSSNKKRSNNELTNKNSKNINKAESNTTKEFKKRRKNLVDFAFFKKLWHFIRIVIPGQRSPEALYLLIFSAFLICRTFLSIKVSEINGLLVKAIVNMDFKQFLKRVGFLALFSIPSSSVNSMLRFLSNKLSLCFRTRLTHYFNDLYLRPLMYYKIINVDDRIENPDQALTTTIENWASSVSVLYSNVTKPLFDILLFSVKLSQLLGVEGPLTVILYYFFCGIIVRQISPPFGKLTARSQTLEGEYRQAHNRLITYSEEIAFYRGHKREKEIIDISFAKIKHHTNYLIGKQFFMGVYDGFLTKYGSVMIGYSVLGLPVFGPNSRTYIESLNNDASRITRDYIRNSSLLISLARAIGRVVSSYKDLQKLAGYTCLVGDLEVVLKDLWRGNYSRKMVKHTQSSLIENKQSPGNGKCVFDAIDLIQFEKVPIVTPNGDILISNPINFSIVNGSNLMVVGPNGCGKSSLFRMLAGLWPVFGGLIRCPKASEGILKNSNSKNLFYIPQRPYLTVGTLREQVIYPETVNEFYTKHGDNGDKILFELFERVRLTYLLDRHGWDKVAEQYDLLSGGEKQRTIMTRLFYHKPKFAVLDECTSAVSVDVEGAMYEHCRRLGISIITVSHRPSLWKYHEFMLKFDSKSNQTFEPMSLALKNSNYNSESLSNNISNIEKKNNVDKSNDN